VVDAGSCSPALQQQQTRREHPALDRHVGSRSGFGPQRSARAAATYIWWPKYIRGVFKYNLVYTSIDLTY
jgi:hypothetical protein